MGVITSLYVWGE